MGLVIMILFGVIAMIFVIISLLYMFISAVTHQQKDVKTSNDRNVHKKKQYLLISISFFAILFSIWAIINSLPHDAPNGDINYGLLFVVSGMISIPTAVGLLIYFVFKK